MTDVQRAMQELAKLVDEIINRGGSNDYGFVLVVFQDEPDGGCLANYVSNCDRGDAMTALRELVRKQTQ